MNRLDLLLKSGQINKEFHLFLNKVSQKINDWSEDDKTRFITHFAIALSRISNHIKVDSLPEAITTEMRENKDLKEAKTYLSYLMKNSNIDIPDDEKWYLLIHILNYLTKK